MSAFDVTYEGFLQALDNYVFAYAEADDKPRAVAAFYTKMDDISNRARHMGVNIQAALDKALEHSGAIVTETY